MATQKNSKQKDMAASVDAANELIKRFPAADQLKHNSKWSNGDKTNCSLVWALVWASRGFKDTRRTITRLLEKLTETGNSFGEFKRVS